MSYNPFDFIFKSRKFFFARIYLTTAFLQRMEDTFFIFFGYYGSGIDSLLDGINPFNRKNIGIFDYVTLGVPFFAHELFSKLPGNIGKNHAYGFLRNILGGISFLLLIVPRLIFSICLTLISLPIIGVAHLWVELGEGKKLREQALKVDVEVSEKYFSQKKMALGDFFQAQKYSQDVLFKCKLTPSSEEDPNTTYSFYDDFSDSGFFTLRLSSQEPNNLYSFFKTNTGNVASNLEDQKVDSTGRTKLDEAIDDYSIKMGIKTAIRG